MPDHTTLANIGLIAVVVLTMLCVVYAALLLLGIVADRWRQHKIMRMFDRRKTKW